MTIQQDNGKENAFLNACDVHFDHNDGPFLNNIRHNANNANNGRQKF